MLVLALLCTRRWRGVVVALLAMCLVSKALHAQIGGGDPQTQMLGELRQIRQILQALAAQVPQGPGAMPTANQPVSLKLSGPRLGRPDAPVAIVEFTDLQCPYCRLFHTGAFDEIKTNYVDTGKVQFVSRDFPLEQLHPLAMMAARANRCAGERGRFWEMRHGILVNNEKLSRDQLLELADSLGINDPAFTSCLDDGRRFAEHLRDDIASGRAAGVSGTPSFIIGKVTDDVLTGMKLSGTAPYASFKAILDEILTKPGAE